MVLVAIVIQTPASAALVSFETKLTASDAAAGDFFGGRTSNSIAASGDTAVVGAYLDDDAGTSSGSAYIFVRAGASWSEQAKLTASDAAARDLFGQAVSIDGDTVVVGSFFDDDAGSHSGSAYIFSRSVDTWRQQAKLTTIDPAEADQFGSSVSVNGDAAVVGAPFDDDLGGDSGSAYVFRRVGANWIQEAKLTANDRVS